MTTAAQVASSIRKDLKQKYPNTKFTVRCQNFAGGNSVDVDYMAKTDGPRLKDVETLLSKYEAGHFDGMIDSYEYKDSKDRNDITVKYLMIKADISDLRTSHKNEFMKYWGLTSEDNEICKEKTGRWFWEALNTYIRNEVLA